MSRQSKNRPTKFKVAIIGEGDTEWYYFTGMRQYEKFNFKVEPELPRHSDYKTIINTARRKRDEGYDLIFCVLDLDRILTNAIEKKGYLAEKSKTRANEKIEFIKTMPCIELWFLLHFIKNYSSKIYINYNQVYKPIKKHIPYYQKTGLFFKSNKIYDLLNNTGNFNNADTFANKLSLDKENSQNPLFNFTDINKLITKLKHLQSEYSIR